eukprot:COSAG01_NODE_2092_length_8449_cov_36.532934_5_plen_117_part_00
MRPLGGAGHDGATLALTVITRLSNNSQFSFCKSHLEFACSTQIPLHFPLCCSRSCQAAAPPALSQAPVVCALVRSPTEWCGVAVHDCGQRLGWRGYIGGRAPCAAAQRGVLVGSAG